MFLEYLEIVDRENGRVQFDLVWMVLLVQQLCIGFRFDRVIRFFLECSGVTTPGIRSLVTITKVGEQAGPGT